MTAFGTIEAPVGVIGVTSDGAAITPVTWVEAVAPDRPADPLLGEAIAQLQAYFTGRLTAFDLPIDLGDQTRAAATVLRTLHSSVRHGEAVAYGELAERSGTAIPARAIGSIMGANPIPIVVPCHRVVASDGLSGYSGGREGEGLLAKRWLLEHEGFLPAGLF